MSLTQKQIDRFAKKVAGRPVEVVVRAARSEKEKKWGGFVYLSTEQIVFFNHVFLKEDELDQKVSILHEVGHLNCSRRNAMGRIEREFGAQMYAIRRARYLGMNVVARRAVRSLQRWNNFDWNSPYRAYILASRLAKKKGLI